MNLNERIRNAGPQAGIKVALGAMTGVIVVLGAVNVARGIQEVHAPETATSTEMIGPGYRITNSRVGRNLLRVIVYNRIPFDSLDGRVERAKERVERACGPIVSHEDEAPSIETTRKIVLVEVFDAKKCFPQR